MGEFKLQVGDVIDKGTSNELTIIGFTFLRRQAKFFRVGDLRVKIPGIRYERRWSTKSLLSDADTVHRQTPNGMVQVWPEVEGK